MSELEQLTAADLRAYDVDVSLLTPIKHALHGLPDALGVSPLPKPRAESPKRRATAVMNTTGGMNSTRQSTSGQSTTSTQGGSSRGVGLPLASFLKAFGLIKLLPLVGVNGPVAIGLWIS